MDDEVVLIGFWNGDKENPEITFHLKESEKDTRKLVYITVELIQEEDQLKQIKTSVKRADKALKSLVKSVKHWEKL